MGLRAKPEHVFLVLQDFMIQAGDPTGTGRGGECIWGGKFEVNPWGNTDVRTSQGDGQAADNSGRCVSFLSRF